MPRYYFDFSDTLAADVDGVNCGQLEDAIRQRLRRWGFFSSRAMFPKYR